MTSWLVCPQKRSRPQLRLFCFAYAGGSAWIFRPWAKQLPASVEMVAIELPGRGQRLAEPPLTNLSLLVDTLGSQLLPYLDLPFAFFGHSLGALIAFELCRWLRRTVQLIPSQLYVSAARAPHLLLNPPLMHRLPAADFIDRLKHYQGTSMSVLNNEELMALMLPTLRADFTLLETYQYRPETSLGCSIIGLWGQQDNIVSRANVADWQVHTSNFELEAVSGDHFFMQQPDFVTRLFPMLKLLIS